MPVVTDDQIKPLIPKDMNWDYVVGEKGALEFARGVLELAQDPNPPKTVAWARRWFIEGEKPAKVKNANGRWVWPTKFKFLPVTPTQCLADDVPLTMKEPS